MILGCQDKELLTISLLVPVYSWESNVARKERAVKNEEEQRKDEWLMLRKFNSLTLEHAMDEVWARREGKARSDEDEVFARWPGRRQMEDRRSATIQ